MNYIPINREVILLLIFGGACILSAMGVTPPRQVKQPAEVIEAYRLCETFQHLLSENLDFARAYEATFPRDRALRRAIAIADGEFGDLDFSRIDDELLIKAYKLRTQIFYLILPLAGPDSGEEDVFFPPEIKKLIQRKAPADSKDFRGYVSQLEQDVAHFRSHLARLSARYPSVADRISKFKAEARAAKFEPPTNYKVKPGYHYYRSEVRGEGEPYYEIEGYSLAKEQGKMRIIGIRFFNRLF
jgi:hypothetical protein